MTHNSTLPDREAARSRAERKLRRLFSTLIAAVAGVLVALVTIAWLGRDATPELTQQRADEARRRWDTDGPKDYQATIVVTGPQPATYRVVVNDGRAISLIHNGTKLTRERVMQTWSVPGMFGTIQSDLDSIRLATDEGRDPQTSDLRLRAEFDARWGYPRQYRRTPMGGQGEVTWTVTEFAPATSEP